MLKHSRKETSRYSSLLIEKISDEAALTDICILNNQYKCSITVSSVFLCSLSSIEDKNKFVDEPVRTKIVAFLCMYF